MLSARPVQVVLALIVVVDVGPGIVADAHVYAIVSADTDIGRAVTREDIREKRARIESGRLLKSAKGDDGDRIIVPVEGHFVEQILVDGLDQPDLGGVAWRVKGSTNRLETAVGPARSAGKAALIGLKASHQGNLVAKGVVHANVLIQDSRGKRRSREILVAVGSVWLRNCSVVQVECDVGIDQSGRNLVVGKGGAGRKPKCG